MQLVIGTVTHPASAPFHEALGDLLRRQTDGDFELLVLDDRSGVGLSPLTHGLRAEVKDAAPGHTPAALRRDLIFWAAERADAILFIDADDWCLPERVAICRGHLAHAPAAAHDLAIVDAEGRSLRRLVGARIADGQTLSLQDLAENNFLGFSNTAGRTPALRAAALRLADHVTAYDWALFTQLLADGVEIAYDSRALSAYRQYANNIASVTCFDAAAIRRAVRVKAEHYALFRDLSPGYTERAEAFANLRARLDVDPQFAGCYLAEAARKASGRDTIWWECAMPMDELIS